MKDFLMVEPAKSKASDYFIEFKDRKGKSWYVTTTALWYKSERYDKYIVCEKYFVSDGATGAYDIKSYGWLFHDKVKKTKKFNDGTECTNLQASHVLSDILEDEGRWFREHSWFISTLIWGTIVK